MQDVLSDYAQAVKKTKDPTAAAILVLADRVAQEGETLSAQLKDFDHQLCIGIRLGLFGTGAGDRSSILDR
jgi:hypothetical protein